MECETIGNNYNIQYKQIEKSFATKTDGSDYSTATQTSTERTCNMCEQPVLGKFIIAMGKAWHPEHFVCNKCSVELGTDLFYKKDGLPYCEKDYKNFLPKCSECHESLTGKHLTFNKNSWHIEHFLCTFCRLPIGEQQGFFEKEGKPFCREDFAKLFAPKCFSCNEPVMDQYIHAMDKKFHPDCFTCKKCSLPIKGEVCYPINGEAICKECLSKEV